MLNPLLIDERYDETILDGMMYQPMCDEMKIKAYVGEDIEDAIYELLLHIETFNGVKL
jgi:hypothetical protein